MSEATINEIAQAFNEEQAAFERLIKELTRAGSRKRAALVKAFRLALNALHARGEIDRLDLLDGALDGAPERTEIRRAIVRFAGGLTRNESGDYQDTPEKSLVMFNAKIKGFVFIGKREAREAARALYEEIQGIDYDCLAIRNPKRALDPKSELAKLAKRINKESVKSPLAHDFLQWAEAHELIEL